MSGKLAGLVLIAGGAAWTAAAWLRLCRLHLRTLGALAHMLELMQGELQTSALPLEQLLKRLLPRLDEAARRFAASLIAGMGELGRRSFSEIWNRSLDMELPELSAAERRELEGLGAVLGRYELSRQLEAISGCRGYLKQQQALAAQALSDKARLALGLALTGAALLGIVLI